MSNWNPKSGPNRTIQVQRPTRNNAPIITISANGSKKIEIVKASQQQRRQTENETHPPPQQQTQINIHRNNNPIEINRSRTPQIPPNSNFVPINRSPTPQPAHYHNQFYPIQSQYKQFVRAPTTFQPPPPPAPPSESFNRLSMLSFVSAFEDSSSFNNVKIDLLGIDLDTKEPILPKLHSVLSEAPLLSDNHHPMPESYSEVNVSIPPSDRISLFSEETLLFIFYTHPGEELQEQAAKELRSRKFSWDPEKQIWKTPRNNEWNVDKWAEIKEE